MFPPGPSLLSGRWVLPEVGREAHSPLLLAGSPLVAGFTHHRICMSAWLFRHWSGSVKYFTDMHFRGALTVKWVETSQIYEG